MSSCRDKGLRDRMVHYCFNVRPQGLPYSARWVWMRGSYPLFCAKDPLKSLVKRTDTFSEKNVFQCMLYRHREILTFLGPCIVIYFYSKTNHMHKFILFWNDDLHVSDGLSVHHQPFKTVHTAVSVWHMPVAVCTILNCWWWAERPSETCSVI